MHLHCHVNQIRTRTGIRIDTISELASPQACLFTPSDLRSVLPSHSDAAFKTLLSRAIQEGALTRLCRGLYVYEKAGPDRGLILSHAAAKLRPLGLNYLSLETVLSDAGVISQIPMNRIMVMSSGRSGVIDFGKFRKEMARFLPNATVKETVNSEKFWEYLSNLTERYHQTLAQTLNGQERPAEFKM